MTGKELIGSNGIQSCIYTIRDLQVMVDSDLAKLYCIEVKVLNQAVKRNSERFPTGFMFQLTTQETENLKSQIVTSSWGGKRKNSYTFTEQGVAMLAGVLKSETAVKTSIHIINAFVAMRRFIATNARIFQWLDTVERKQLEADENFKKIFNAIEAKEIIPKQGIFFNGQIFDAYKFVSDLFRTAKKSIIII